MLQKRKRCGKAFSLCPEL
uniref:Uncharacterized protein n=1 Tax=Rhizophora mucronata TaxID=61149 RepID=A0A2P2QBS6_RHIMU